MRSQEMYQFYTTIE